MLTAFNFSIRSVYMCSVVFRLILCSTFVCFDFTPVKLTTCNFVHNRFQIENKATLKLTYERKWIGKLLLIKSYLDLLLKLKLKIIVAIISSNPPFSWSHTLQLPIIQCDCIYDPIIDHRIQLKCEFMQIVHFIFVFHLHQSSGNCTHIIQWCGMAAKQNQLSTRSWSWNE